MILSPHLVILSVGIYLKEILQKKEQEMCTQIFLAGLSSLGENCKQSKCQQWRDCSGSSRLLYYLKELLPRLCNNVESGSHTIYGFKNGMQSCIFTLIIIM